MRVDLLDEVELPLNPAKFEAGCESKASLIVSLDGKGSTGR